jgi:hypothetical protein
MGINAPASMLHERAEIRREAQLLRGEFLDGFARLETSINSYLALLDVRPRPNAPFGQRMAALKAARERFRAPKKLDDRLAAIAVVAAFRADLVHSVLTVAHLWDGKQDQWLLMFRNAGDVHKAPLIMSCDDLRKAVGRIETLAHQFSQQQLTATTPAARACASE